MEKDIKLALQYKNPNEIFPDSLFTVLYWSISYFWYSIEEKKSQLKIIEEKEKKLIQTITVSKRFINCLNKSKIIPQSIIDEFATQKKIIVTKDYEYIVEPKNAIRNKINN